MTTRLHRVGPGIETLSEYFYFVPLIYSSDFGSYYVYISTDRHPYSFSINSLLVDEIVYDLLADFGYSNTDRKVLYCVYGFHFLT